MRIRSTILMSMLDEQKATLVLPSVILGELLVPIPKTSHAKFLSEVSKAMECVGYDVPAAAIAAELWQQHKKLDKNETYGDRKLLKADVMIIATAKVNGCEVFYSHDKAARKLAGTVMQSKDLPTKHPNMYTDLDIRDAIK